MERDSAETRDTAGTSSSHKIVQLSLTPAPHRNQQLFSDHYLNVLLPARPDWQILRAEAEPVLRELRQLFATYMPSDKEAQTEEDWIKPVLRSLGHTFEVQPSLETPDGTKTPDYVFYRDQAALLENKGRKINETLLQSRAIAVGDAKYWDRPLDVSLKRSGGDPFTNKNPSYQIAFYMQHSGLDWGILTNGRLWRLYHKETAHKLDRFYEVNLPELLQSGDVQNFLYFYIFFRRQAFEAGALGIEEIRSASVDHARGVSDSLKAQVYEALRHVAQGFLDYRPNHLQTDQETLKAIYDNALIVLYRLLFILYAEARELLPVQENADYRESYSLDRLKKRIQRDLVTRKLLLPTSATLWAQLQALFTIIDEGSPPLSVATFNGGLFDPERHPFLEKYAIGDFHLQQAIDKLARVQGQFVDYRDLAERHLGTIYEGLLEYTLHVASEPMIELRSTSAIVPERLATARDVAAIYQPGEVYLVTNTGQRKTTGSYYTPDYIVKYMVEETLGPALRQAVAGASSEQEKIQAILNLKVLDPAMGSGHFPVEATEYIARFLVEQVEQPQSDTRGETELAYWKRRVVQSCIYGVDLNPLAVDLAKLSLWLATVAKDRPLSFLDHHLRNGNSLIGARLADLRIGSASAKKPIKKRTAHASQAKAAQPTLFDEESLRQAMNTAVDLMWLIETSPAQSVSEVKQQERTYSELRQQLTSKYTKLANLVSATHFGVMVDLALWQPLADYATGRISIAPTQFDAWLQAANSAASAFHFFHWELEFPEVFFNRHGQPKGAEGGFDVVIGNPPYVRQEKLAPLKPAFAALYMETYDGVADLYIYFYQQGLRLTRAGGRMSYIVTNKWMRAGYGQPLRNFFASAGALERIIDFGHAPIFEDADVFPCILVLEKPSKHDEPEQQLSEHLVQVLNFPREDLRQVVEKRVSLGSYVQTHSHMLPRSRFSSAAWNLETSAADDLLAKIQRVGVPLAEFAGVKPFYGIKTGLNEAFLIDTPTKERLVLEDPRCAKIIKPYLRGQDIKRWSPEWAGLWMIVLKSSGDQLWPWSHTPDTAQAEEHFRQAYPSLYGHLKPLEERLRTRQDRGRYWWELRACAYYHAFEQLKIMYQVIQFYPSYGIDNSHLLSNDKTFFIARTDNYLLAVLNSPLMWWHNWRYLPHMKDEALNPARVRMETLPIAQPNDTVRAEADRAVSRLIEITRANQETRQISLDWLRVEFDVQEPGRRLENFSELDLPAFLDEVRKRRPRAAGKLTPASLRALQSGYSEQLTPIQQRRSEATALERRLSELVNAAYGLTPEEVALMWETAPPRMPFKP